MRDFLLPIILIITTIFGAWLAVIGPLPFEVGLMLKAWQPLIAATVASTVASIAAFIAFRNTSRSLQHAEALEKHRRSRKHAALRAVLPLALAQVTNYAEQSARSLSELASACKDEALVPFFASADFVQALPSETLTTLADFIEYSDVVDVAIIEATVGWIQVHDSRLRSLVEHNRDPSRDELVTQTQIENVIVDAAAIYAGAGAVYRYARRQDTQLPNTISWEEVERALRNMRLWDHEYPRLYENLIRRKRRTTGPFERLNTPTPPFLGKSGSWKL